MTNRNRLVTTVSSVASSGLGAFTISSARTGYRTFVAADDGLTFDGITIVDGDAWEVRNGCVYTHSGTSLSRGTLEDSSTGSAISMSSSAILTQGGTAGRTATYGVDESGNITSLVSGDGVYPVMRGLQKARTSAAIAEYCYGLLPPMPAWGVEASPGGIYYDSNYSGGDSDGSLAKPYTSLDGVTFSTPGQFVNLAYGSNFLPNFERSFCISVTAPDVTFRAYGDSSRGIPIVSGGKSYTTFSASGSEFRKAISLSLSHTHYYVAYADNPWAPLQLGTAVGALASGQYIFDGGFLYVKDDPGARAVLLSVCRTVLHSFASGTKIDQVAFLGSSNDTVSFTAGSGSATVVENPWMRDCVVGFSGNNGVKIGNSDNGCKGAIIIRHTDIGSRNNGIYGDGDDGPAYLVEPRCYGVLRAAGDIYGYVNDCVTAHGQQGLQPWVVVGGYFFSAKEDAIDIIGATGGGTLHKDSVIAYNQVDTCGESGIYAWCENPIVRGNLIKNTQWSPIQMGETTPVSRNHGGLVEGNFVVDGGKSANSCGVNLGWNGISIRNNTIIRSAASARAALGNLDLTLLNLAYVERNLFILEEDAAIIQTTSGNAALIKLLGFRDNAYVIPASNVVSPFSTGGSPRAFAAWVSDDIERSAVSYTSPIAAGLTETFKPAAASPLLRRGAFPEVLDIDGRSMNSGVGAYAPAQKERVLRQVMNLVSTAVQAALTGTITKTALRQIAIPDGAMGPNSRLIIKPIWGYTNSANNKTLTVDVGTTLGGATNVYSRTRSTTAAEMPLIEIANRNDVAAQLIGYAQTGSFATAQASANTTTAINFGSSGMNLYVCGTLSNTGETIALDSLQVDIINPYE